MRQAQLVVGIVGVPGAAGGLLALVDAVGLAVLICVAEQRAVQAFSLQ